jgi:hypothetical protein
LPVFEFTKLSYSYLSDNVTLPLAVASLAGASVGNGNAFDYRFIMYQFEASSGKLRLSISNEVYQLMQEDNNTKTYRFLLVGVA